MECRGLYPLACYSYSMPMNRFRVTAASLFALALLLAACSSGDESASDGGNDISATSASTDSGNSAGGGETPEESEGQVESSTIDGVESPGDLSGPVNAGSVSDLVLALTGQPPADTEVTCLVDISEGDSQLTEVFNGSANRDMSCRLKGSPHSP